MKEQEKPTNKKGYLNQLPERLLIQPFEYPEPKTPPDNEEIVNISSHPPTIKVLTSRDDTLMAFGDVNREALIDHTTSQVNDADSATIFLKRGLPSLEPKQDSPLVKLIKDVYRKLRKNK